IIFASVDCSVNCLADSHSVIIVHLEKEVEGVLNSFKNILVVILYGILATTLKVLLSIGISKKFMLRTFTSGLLLNVFFSERARLLSNSTAITLSACSDKGLVRAPLPAPISMTISLLLI